MRWFISDIHFWHRNVIQYCNRPWATIEEMNAGLVERINALVQPGDEVYCLGDFSLSFQGAEMVKYLNGTWHLIPGNHDKCHSTVHKEKPEKKANCMKRYHDMGFVILPEYYTMVLTRENESMKVQMCHFPFKEDHGNFESQPRFQKLRPVPLADTAVLLHGHVHNAWKERMFWSEEQRRFIPQINLGVDVWDWRPVSEEELFLFCKKELDYADGLSQIKREEEANEDSSYDPDGTP